MRNNFRLLVPVLLAVGLAVPQAAQADPIAPSAVGDVQLVISGQGNTTLDHAIRHEDGRWDRYGVLPVGFDSTQLASVIVNGEEHLFFQETHNQGSLYVNIRHFDGTWDLAASAPDGFTTVNGQDPLAVAYVNGALHVVRVHDNQVQHSMRNVDGTWSAFATVPMSGAFINVAVTSVGVDLRIVAINADGSALAQTDRHADGFWSPARRTAFVTDAGAGGTNTVGVAQIGDDLHVVAVDFHGSVFHSVMHANLSWDLFRNIGIPAGEPGYVATVGVTASHGVLHVAVGTVNDSILHTIRFADGSWQRFGNVKAAIGNPGGGIGLTIAGQ